MEWIRGICPLAQPPQLDFDPTWKQCSIPTSSTNQKLLLLLIPKKSVLHCFQTVYLEAWTLKKSTDRWQNSRKSILIHQQSEECSYYAVIIHVDINDILSSKQCDKFDKLPGNIIKVANNCQKYETGNIYIYQQFFHRQEQILIFLTFTKSYAIYVWNAILNLSI